MSACSRCGSRFPNSSCFVCAEPEEEEKPYDDDIDNDDYLERLLDRSDHYRTERKDREMEDAMEARGEQDEEERKLGLTP